MEVTSLSRLILVVVAVLCIVVLSAYPASAAMGDAVRGVCTSVLAAELSLIMFYYVDPRHKRPTYKDVLADSGLRRVARNKEFESAFWTDVISELPTAEQEVFLVGKRLSEWRAAPVYSDPLLNGLKKRVERAKDCRSEQKYVTTIIVEDHAAHTEWTSYLGGLNWARVAHSSVRRTLPYPICAYYSWEKDGRCSLCRQPYYRGYSYLRCIARFDRLEAVRPGRKAVPLARG